VLLALGYPEDVARTAVRFSWGPDVTAERLAAVGPAVGEAVRAVSRLGDGPRGAH